MTNEPSSPLSYRTLDDIRQRKQELRMQFSSDGERISRLWSGLFVKRSESTQGEFISSILSNSALAIDAFLMFRKLRKLHKNLFHHSRKK